MKHSSKSKPSFLISVGLLLPAPLIFLLLPKSYAHPGVLALIFLIWPAMYPPTRQISRPTSQELQFPKQSISLFFLAWTALILGIAGHEGISLFFLELLIVALPEEYFFRLVWFRHLGKEDFSPLSIGKNLLIFTAFHCLSGFHPIHLLLPIPTAIIIYFWKSKKSIWICAWLHTLLNLTDRFLSGEIIRSWLDSLLLTLGA